MPSHEQNGEIVEHRYTINIPERVRELMLNGEIDEQDEIHYTWRGGYEILLHKKAGGEFDYRGVYHPGDGCCQGRGVCIYCGRTLFDD